MASKAWAIVNSVDEVAVRSPLTVVFQTLIQLRILVTIRVEGEMQGVFEELFPAADRGIIRTSLRLVTSFRL